MLSLRWLLALVIIVVAASVGIMALNQETPRALGRWLPGLEDHTDRIDRIAVYQGQASPSVLVVREDKRWRVQTLGGYPADLNRLRDLVQSLLRAKRLEPRTDKPQRLSALNLDDPFAVDTKAVLLELSGEEIPVYQLVLGADSPRGQIVRRLEESQSWLVDESVPVDRHPVAWVDTLVMNLAPDQISRIVLDGGEQSYSMQREDGQWQVSPVPEGRELRAQPFLAQPAESLSGLRFDAVERLTDSSLESALASVEYHFLDGATLTAWRMRDGEGRWVRFTLDAPDSGDSVLNWSGLEARLSGWRFQFPVHRMATLFRPLEEQLTPAAEPAAD